MINAEATINMANLNNFKICYVNVLSNGYGVIGFKYFE